MKIKLLAGFAAAAAFLTTPALAQGGDIPSDIPSDFELSGNVGLFSEYRFRGIDFSDGDLALQGGIDLGHSSGFYVGTWASNLAGFGDFGGSHLELDLYGGYAGSLGSVGTFDVGALWYLYPGTDDTDYVELYGSVGADIAGAGASVGVAWAPDQANADDSIYLYGDLGYGIPETPISLSAHLGYTDGFFGFGGLGGSGEIYDDNYWDWSIGASADLYGLSFGATYVDTDIDEDREIDLGLAGPGVGSLIADDTIVLSVSYSF